MKLYKSFIALVASAFLASSAVMPANATDPGPDPVLNTLPTFSVSGSAIAANAGGWVNGSTYLISGDPILQAFACRSSKSGTTETQFQDTYEYMVERTYILSGCAPLYADQAATTPFSSGDLTTAYLKDFGVFTYSSQASTYPHILMLSYVNTEFFDDPSTKLVRFGFSASQEVSLPDTTPTVSTPPSFSITETTVTLDDGTGTWTSGDVVNEFYVCGFETAPTSSNVTNVQTSFFSIPGSCARLTSEDPADYSPSSDAPAFTGGDLSSAYYGPIMQYYPGGVETNPHLVVISKNTVGSSQYYIFSPSQQVTVSGNNDYSGPIEMVVALSPATLTIPGTSVGDVVTVNQPAVWPSSFPNDLEGQPRQYQWLVGASCSATSWGSFLVEDDEPIGSSFTIPAQIDVLPGPGITDLSVGVQTTTGLAFALGAMYGNSANNLFGGRLTKALVVGGEVCTNSVSLSPDSQDTADVVRAAPYTGPVLNTPSLASSIAAGGKVVIPGSNLSGVSAVEIGGVSATVVVNSDGELEITVPAGLAAGTYDLVVVSSSGRLTVQNAITVSGSAVDATAGTATTSTKRMPESTAKVWVFDVVGAGKVQIFVNGKEIAWVNATDANDPKLFNGYLVRTVELAEGKNIIEVFVDGERVRRTAYAN